MRTYLFILLTAAVLPSCTTTECGEGTIDRNGSCEPASETVGNAMCGPFTHLVGTVCVPTVDPTKCDLTTTTPQADPDNPGVTLCVGTGTTGGCGGTLACPTPSDQSHQTICGQLFDFETGDKFVSDDHEADGTACTTTTATGPCSLVIDAFDAFVYAGNPTGAPKLQHGPLYIDDCGRYRVPDIAVPTNPIVGLGIDDADSSKMGPLGTTTGVGIATAKNPGTATQNLDGYIVKQSTTTLWEMSGGPPLSGGIFAPVYRANKTGRALQAGVTFTKAGNPVTSNDFYFKAADTVRTTIVDNLTATGANGTALITGAKGSDLLIYSGTGGLDATCEWSKSAGASLPNIVFVQDFRPVDIAFSGMTCDR